jgi:hypothetical protein
LVNGKVKEKKFEVHHTSEPESSDPPPYVLPVCSATLASQRFKSNAEDPSGKEETSGLDPLPCHPVFPHYTSLYSNDSRGREEPLGKVTEFWEANN